MLNVVAGFESKMFQYSTI